VLIVMFVCMYVVMYDNTDGVVCCL